MRLRWIVLLVALAAALAAFAGIGRPEGAGSATGSPGRTITVTGTGIVATVPNRAGFSFGVTAQAKTATAALDAVATDMRKVIAALKAAGVALADIQTQSIQLNPRYSDNGQDILGYMASSSVSAEIKNINRAGGVVDAAVNAGANQVSGPNLTRSDRGRLYRIALRAAVADARSKAQAIAAASGARLRSVRSVTESSAAPQPLPAQADSGISKSAPPVQPGTQLIEADVLVEFTIG
jgi:uncharacterized protein YggE